MKTDKESVKKFLINVLLVIELTIYIAYVHLEKVLFVVVIALDQYFKALVINSMEVGETIPVISNIFHITLVLNPGAAFGILPHQRIFFIAMGTIILIVAAIYYSRLKNLNSVMKFGGVFAASGALANLIDRIQHGFVIDFLDMRVFNFPVFNIADIAIVVGMFIMMYVIMFKSEETSGIKEVRQP